MDGSKQKQPYPLEPMVHELENLISVIIAEAQLLQLGHEEGDPNHASAVAIERAGRRLERLLDTLFQTPGLPMNQSATGPGDRDSVMERMDGTDTRCR